MSENHDITGWANLNRLINNQKIGRLETVKNGYFMDYF